MTAELLYIYGTWLAENRRWLAWEMAKGNREHFEFLKRYNYYSIGSRSYHPHDAQPSTDVAQPSTRAALVLSAVGCDWREDRA